jgi:hypothetical protein
MSLLRGLLTLLIIPYFLFPPQVFGQVLERKTSKMVYQQVMGIAEKKTSLLMRSVPMGNIMLINAEKKEAVKSELTKKISELENATNAEVAGFKKALLKLNEQELGEMSRELQGYLNALSDKEISEIGASLFADRRYEGQALEYSVAFTSIEKKRAISNALMEDLGFLRSVYSKKIGLAKREDLQLDLEHNLSIFEQQHAQKTNVKELLQISLLVLAGVALVSWGISSAVYGARLSRVRSERENKLTELKNDLNNQYNAYHDLLTKQEMDFLNANGFVRTVCGTFQQADSILCNRYDYKVFSGTKFCSVYCYKNAQTGKETLHEAPVCTSPFIPADCYDPKEYWDAHARGKKDGYDDGYNQGRNDGKKDGDYYGRRNGDSDGYDDGYAWGYHDGYYDGYASGAASAKSRSIIPFKMNPEYLKGFKDGLEQYQVIFLNY